MSIEWPAGVGRIVLNEVDSTNAEAMRRADRLDRPTWIMARRQTAARGRRGRAWAMPDGNFAASLVLRPDSGAEEAARHSFVAALALFDAVAGLGGRPETLTLKWPNDLLLNGGKLAGILLESVGSGHRIDCLVIGVGVNLVKRPAEADLESGALPAVALAEETGIQVSGEAFFDALAVSFARRDALRRQEGFQAIRQAWLARAARLGQTIVARVGTEEHRGRFETVDEHGALVLNTASGRRAIPAADVYF